MRTELQIRAEHGQIHSLIEKIRVADKKAGIDKLCFDLIKMTENQFMLALQDEREARKREERIAALIEENATLEGHLQAMGGKVAKGGDGGG